MRPAAAGRATGLPNYGELNARKDNAIVFPTFFGSQHPANEPMIGPGMALDPSRYFIIIPNLFGNGLSSSPGNTPAPYDRARFPRITYYDNIRQQYRLVTEQFGVERVALVCGFSMGAMQAFHWGRIVSRPGGAHRPVVRFGAHLPPQLRFPGGGQGRPCAPTTPGTTGWYDAPPAKGLRAMARVYAGWAPSQAFYRERVYFGDGSLVLEDYLINSWEGRYLQLDANNILAMVATWQAGDISDNPLYGGDFEKALVQSRPEPLSCPPGPTSTSRRRTTRLRYP